MNEHRGEISIGQDEWIPYFDLEGRHDSAVEIDFLLRDSEDVWGALETACVAGCCSIAAFEFWPEDVARAAGDLEVHAAVGKIERLRSAVERICADVLVSRRLNCYFNKRQFTMLLDHLFKSFRAVAPPP